MAILNNVGYSYNDVTIVPSCISKVSSRSQCNPFLDDGYLPLFTAPMSCVVNIKNLSIWKHNKITPILPRTIDIDSRLTFVVNGYWVAMSLDEFKTYFVNGDIESYSLRKQFVYDFSNENTPTESNVYKVCIDIANGHMKSLYDNIKKAKDHACKWGYELVVMAGNIANPETYGYLYESGVDYVRLSIGSGNGCLTTSNTAIHYPIATLIDECQKIRTHGYYKEINNGYPKIIADGGIRNYSDIIKALALGADYVMVGSLFSTFLESAAETYVDNGSYKNSSGHSYVDAHYRITEFFESVDDIYRPDNEILRRKLLERYGGCMYKKFYGMSTKQAQIEIAKANNIKDFKMKTSEGVEKMLPCKYTIAQWVDNFLSYLKSAMSYTDAKTLKKFQTSTRLIVNSPNEINAVNK